MHGIASIDNKNVNKQTLSHDNVDMLVCYWVYTSTSQKIEVRTAMHVLLCCIVVLLYCCNNALSTQLAASLLQLIRQSEGLKYFEIEQMHHVTFYILQPLYLLIVDTPATQK